MPKTKKVLYAGRFGARYGKRTRQSIIDVEKRQKAKQKCPYCCKLAVKRIAAGIFKCKKCNKEFTNKAYFLE